MTMVVESCRGLVEHDFDNVALAEVEVMLPFFE